MKANKQLLQIKEVTEVRNLYHKKMNDIKRMTKNVLNRINHSANGFLKREMTQLVKNVSLDSH